jgi:DNA-binding MarR family transcriptional regulator
MFESVLVIHLAALLTKSADHALTEQSDLTMAQFKILMVLQNQKTIYQHTIAECFGLSAAAISRLIEVLVEKKYITRTVDAANRRRHTLHLTDLGLEKVTQSIELIRIMEKELYSVLSKQELAQFKSILQRLVEKMGS